MTELHHGTVAAPLEWSDVRIFDTFKNEDGRKAHLTGEVAKALFAKAEELFASEPQISMADLLATK